VIGGAAAGLLLLLLLLLCCCWFLVLLPRRRRKREAEAEAAKRRAALRKSHPAGMSSLRKKTATVAGLVGAGVNAPKPKPAAGPKPTVAAMDGMFTNVHSAMLRAKRTSAAVPGTVPANPNGGGAAAKAGPRLSFALAAYKSGPGGGGGGAGDLRAKRKSLLTEDGTAANHSPRQEEDWSGVDDSGFAPGASPEEDDWGEEEEEGAEAAGAGRTQDGGVAPADAWGDADDDFLDEDAPVEDAAAGGGGDGRPKRGGYLRNKQRARVAEPSAEPAKEVKIVIGKGELKSEAVVHQTVKLKRVSRIRGDRTLTALRKEQPQARPSVAGGGGYAFTAAVGRVQLRAPTKRAALS